MQILLKFKLYPFKMNFELKSSQVQQLVRTMGLFFLNLEQRTGEFSAFPSSVLSIWASTIWFSAEVTAHRQRSGACSECEILKVSISDTG